MKITKNCLKTISYRKSPQRTALAVATALAFASTSSPSWSNPTGGQVVGGSATISTPSASSMVIDQTSNKAIINWNTFSIGAGESVRFNQPSASSIALNRVLGNTRSEIFGSLTANGQIFLVNPNGVLMARGAEVSAAGFLASSLGITDGDFLAGRYNFTRGAIAGTVINEGNILTPGGYTALLAPNIVNNGLISARLGSVALAAGDRVTLDFNGDGLLRVAVDEATLSAAIKNSGTITADGGRVILTAKSANALLDTVLNNEGVIRADTLVDRNGVIALESSAGITSNSGSLLARGLNAGERGGDISITAPGINLQSTGVANASGAAGGGNVRITSSGLVQANGVIEASGGTGAGGGVSIQSDVLVQTGGIDAASASDAGGNVNIQTRNLLSAGAINANGAAGGSIDIQASNSIIQTASAQLTASGTAGNGGHITLQAAKGLFSSGTVQATGAGDDGAGGAIKVLGSQIVLQGATLDASGDAGGGSVLVGGDFQGKNTAVPNAQSTSVNFASTLSANANNTGDGGKVVVWSNEQTTFYGKVSARGGAQSGDGGAIEVSGKENLTFGGLADAGAPHGKAGTLLLDPKNITIDSAAPSFSVIDLVDPNISAGEGFANSVVALSSGNIVATNGNDNFVASKSGAVYLFNGKTGALISSLNGSSPNDLVGLDGVTVLTNGNYVVRSPSWNNGAATAAGAVTFGSGATGISGNVSNANSLVGTTTNDRVGSGGVTALTNGNYVVNSHFWDNGAATNAGAVTFGSGVTGISGNVSNANSLVGTTNADRVGVGGITALANGNYVVNSTQWNNGAATNAGAVTFGSGTTGISGNVSNANSLVGATTVDSVGGGGVTALTNGNYVVSSPNWSNVTATQAGAVTFGSGTTGISGSVSNANSLVGTTTNDRVGVNGVTALTNGNYVVNSFFWNNGAATQAGAVTFGSGTTGISGSVSNANSLVGTTTDDRVGVNGVTALTNGNYVVNSSFWNNGAATQAGAVTFGSGTTGISGNVSNANSLVGTTTNDRVGSGGVTALTNGNYVVNSNQWNNGAATSAGAVTFGSGATGISGNVSNANSLVGTTTSDQVGFGGVAALTNGNYVVNSNQWNNGAATSAGAVTFGSGVTGISGNVSNANSLVGTTTNDQVGIGGITALTNGNYVVNSKLWNNGAATSAGAVTFGSGVTGISGNVSNANSLVGTTTNDQVGIGGITALTNGNYVVNSKLWNNGAATLAGAVTFGSGITGISGNVSNANSLVGTTTNDGVGIGSITALTNGNYVVNSSSWNNGAATKAGAVTFGSGTTGISGNVSNANSLVGATTSDGVGSGGVTALTNGNYVVNSPLYDNAGKVDSGKVVLVSTDVTNPLTFGNNAAAGVTISPSRITAITNTGTAVVLQANNDIVLNAASSIVTTPAGVANGGNLTLQAGRSVQLQSNITSANGNVTIVANETAANGVIDAQRDPGTASISMSPGATINAGSGTISLKLADGAGLTNNASGDIQLGSLKTTGSISLINSGSGGALTQSGGITAGTLTLSTNNGAVTLQNSGNAIANLGTSALGTGALNLKTGVALTVTGAVGATGGITLESAGPLAINQALNAGAGNVSLTSSGGGTSTISQTAGVITANTLNVTTAGASADFTQANQITNLGAVSLGAAVFTLNNATGLTVNGQLTSVGANLTTAGPLTIANKIDTGSGSISLTTTGVGPITQTGSGALVAVGGKLTVTTANSDVTLIPQGAAVNNVTELKTINTGTGNFSYTGNGAEATLFVTGGNAGSLTVTNNNGISMTGEINTAKDAVVRSVNKNVGANQVLLISTAGGISVRANEGIDLEGQLKAADATNGNITLISDTKSVTTAKGFTIGNTYTVQAGPGQSLGLVNLVTDTVTNKIAAPNVALIADSLGFADFNGFTGTGTLSVAPRTGGTPMDIGTVGAATVGALTLDQAALNTLASFGTINFGKTGVLALPASTNTAGVINVGSSNITNANLNLFSMTGTGTAITQSGALLLGAGNGTLSVATAGGNVALPDGGNTVGTLGTVSTGAGTFTLNDSAGGLIITGPVSGTGIAMTTSGADMQIKGVITDAGNTILTNTTGGIVQTAPAPITNNDLTINAAKAITLTDPTNNLKGEVKITNAGANDVAITNSGGLLLGSSSVGTGTLTLTALGGAITQSLNSTGFKQAAGAGAATFNAGTGVNANNITLDKTGNNFAGQVSLTGKNIVFHSDPGTKLTVTLSTTGSATLKADPNIEGAVGGDLTVDALGTATNFGPNLATTVGGNLTLTNTDTVTQTAGKSLQVTGTTLIDGTAKNATITLNEGANRFTGAATFKGSTIQVTDSGALNATLQATDASTLKAGGNLSVTGSSKSLITTTTGGGDTTTTALAVTNGDLTVFSAGKTIIGAGPTNVNGNVTLNTVGDVSQTGVASQLILGGGELSIFAAGGGNPNVTLGSTNNTVGKLGGIAIGKGAFTLNNLGDLNITGSVQKAGGGYTIVNDGKLTHVNTAAEIDTTAASSGAAADGNISLTTINGSNDLLLNNNLKAAAGNVTLLATGNVTQAGAGSNITANAVSATATAANTTVTLNSANNKFSSISGSSPGNFSATDSIAMTVGAAGVASAGANVTLLTTNGNLTLTGPVSANAATGVIDLKSSTGSVISTAAAGTLSGNSALVQAATNVDLYCGNLTCATSGNAINTIAGIATNGFFALQNNTALDVGTVNGVAGITSKGVTLLQLKTGNLTQSQVISSAGGLAIGVDAGDATLNLANTITGGNVAGAALGNGKSITFRNQGAFNVGKVSQAVTGGTLEYNGLLTQQAAGGTISLTSNSGAITQSAGASDVINTNTLLVSTANQNATLMNTGNTILNLGTVNVGATGGFALANSAAMAVTGTVTGDTINLTQTGAGNGITQTAGGIITANNLIVTTNGGSADFTTAPNSVVNLAATDTTTGTFALTDVVGGLTVTSPVTGAGITVTSSDFLKVNSTVTSGGTVSVNTTAAGGGKDITQTAVITAGTLKLSANGSNATLNSVTNVITNLGASNLGTGELKLLDAGGLTVTGAVAATGGITLNTSGALAVNDTLNAGGGNVSLTTTGAGNAISQSVAGVITANTLSLTTNAANATLDTATNAITNLGVSSLGAGTLKLRDAGGLTVSGFTVADNGVSLSTSGAIAINAPLSTNAVGDMSLTTTGAGNPGITQNAVITTNGLSLVTANGNVTLNTLTNTVGKVTSAALGTGALALQSGIGLAVPATSTVTATGGIDLKANALTLDGTLDAGVANVALTTTAPGFGVTQAAGGSITGGTLTLTTSNGNVGLGQTNNLTNLGATALGTGSLTLNDVGGLTVAGAVAASGGITLSTSGALAVNNTLNAGAGSVSLNTTGAGNAITQSATGVITASTLTLSTNNADATLNGAIHALTNLGATSLGSGALNLLDAGGLTVTGAVAATGGITLNTSGALAINNTLAAGTGNLSLTSSGAGNTITQTAAISGTGLTATTAGGAITLTKANDFTGVVNLTGGTTQITDATALTLGTIATSDLTAVSTGALNLGQGTVTGNLTATSNGGAITQDTAAGKSLTVTGTSTINAGANTITLTSPGNNFTGAVSLNNSGANNVQLTQAGNLILGASAMGTGTATLTAGGTITQNGALTGGGTLVTSSVGGTTLASANTMGAFNATNTGGGVITFTNTAVPLAVTGVSQSGGGTTAITNAGTINTTGTISSDGDINLTATGATSDINVLANMTGTAVAARNLTLRADRDVVIGNGTTALSITGNNAALNMDFNADRDANSQGVVFFNSATAGGNVAINVTTGGGFLNAHGGNGAGGATDTTRAFGHAETGGSTNPELNRRNGVSVAAGTTINAGAGNVTLYGQGMGAVAGAQQSHNGVAVSGAITTTGGNVTLDGIGGAQSNGTASAFGVIVSNGTIDTSAGAGKIILTGVGGTVAGTGTGNSAGVAVSNSNGAGTGGTVLAGSGGVAITGTGGAGVTGSSHGVFISGGTNLTSSTVRTNNGGAINVTGTGGTTTAITGIGVAGVQLGRGSNTNPPIEFGTISTDSGVITVTGTGGSSPGVTATFGSGIGPGVSAFNGSFIITRGAGTVSITGTGGTGNTAARYAGILTSSDQTLPQPNNSIGGATATSVTLTGGTSTGINLNNTNVTTAAAGTLTLDATGGNLTASTARLNGGGLRVLSSGNAALTNTANDMTTIAANITGAGSSFSYTDKNAVTVGTVGAASGITTNGGTVTLTTTTGTSLAANVNAGAGSVTFNDGVTLSTASTITGNGGVTFAKTVDGANALAVNSTGTTTFAGAVGGTKALTSLTTDAGGSTAINGGSITTNGAAGQTFGDATSGNNVSLNAGTGPITATTVLNDFTGTLTLTGGTVQVTDNNALTAVLATTGPTTLAAGASGAAGGNLVVSGTTTGAGAHLTTTTLGTAGTTSFGVTTVGGKLTTTSSGAVTQTGAITVNGTADINAGASDITLNLGNDFVFSAGTSKFTGKNVVINDATQLDALLAATGAANLTAGGNMLVAGSAAGLTTTTTAGATPGNTTFGATTVTGGNSLTVTSAGAVAQTGAIVATGASTINAGANAITLTDPANNFTGALGLTGGTVQVTDANALTTTLATSGPTTLVAGANGLAGGNLTVSGTTTGAGAHLTTTTTAGSAGITKFGTTTVSGNLLTNSAGAVSQTGGLNISGSITVNAGANPITLNAGNKTGLVNLFNSGANDVSFSNAVGLFIGTITVGTGKLDLISTPSGMQQHPASIISQAPGAGPVTLKSDSGRGDITLDNSNNFTGVVTAIGNVTSINNANALTAVLNTNGATTLKAGGNLAVSGTAGGGLSTTTTGTGTTSFGTTTVTGTLTTTSAGAVSQTGSLTVAGASTINAGTNDITLTNAGNSLGFGLVTATGNAIQLSNSFSLTTAFTSTGPTILNVPLGNVALSGSAAGLSVNGTGFVTFGKTTVTGNLAATGTGIISQTSAMTVTGTSNINAGTGSIALTDPANDFSGTLTLTGGSAQVTDANALTAALNISSPFSGPSTLSAGGNLTLSGSAAGLTAITTGTGSTNFGPTTVTGNLVATSAGAVSQTGALNVTGTSNINASANKITLTNGVNNFTGAVSLSNTGPNDAAINDINGLTLTTTNVGQKLDVTAGPPGITLTGNVTSNGAQTYTGGVTLATGVTLNAGAANAINLGVVAGGGNNLTTTGLTAIASTTSNFGVLTANQTLTTGGAIGATSVTVSGTSTLGGNVTTSGASGQTYTGAVSAGALTLNAGTGPISATNAANDFTGTLTLTGGTVQVTDTNALTAVINSSGASTLKAGGNLALSGSAAGLTASTTGTGTTSFGTTSVNGSLTSTSAGAVSQTGALSVTGTSNINAGTNAITLTNAANDFTGALTLTGGTVQVTDTNALTAVLNSSGASTLKAGGNLALSGSAAGLTATTTGTGTTSFGTTSVNGSLTSTSAGAVSQTGALSVTGTSNINAGTNAITLTNAANDFTGPVSLNNSGANNVAINDTNALNMGASTLGSGTLTVTSGGAITQTGAVTQAPNGGTVSISAGANPITLTAANDFTGTVTATGSNVTLNDINALTAIVNATGTNVINGGGPLNISGTLNNLSSTATGAGASITATSSAPTLTITGLGSNNGAVNLTSNNLIIAGNGALGTGVLTTNGTAQTLQSGAITAGGYTLATGAMTLAGGSMTLTGPLTVSPATFLTGGATVVNGPTANVSGTFSLGGTTSTTLTNTNVLAGGLLTGVGTLKGNVNNSGTVAPGNSPGIISVAGNFTQTAAGVLNIEVGGTTAGTGYDRIAVTGNAVLDGTLNVQQFGGYLPAQPERFQIITTTGTDTGTFATVNRAPFAAFTALAVNYQSTFTELFFPIAQVLVPPDVIVGATAAPAGTATPLFITSDRGPACLVGDVELLFYPKGAPISVPK